MDKTIVVAKLLPGSVLFLVGIMAGQYSFLHIMPTVSYLSAIYLLCHVTCYSRALKFNDHLFLYATSEDKIRYSSVSIFDKNLFHLLFPKCIPYV